MLVNKMNQVQVDSNELFAAFEGNNLANHEWSSDWENQRDYKTKQWKTSGNQKDLTSLANHCLELSNHSSVSESNELWIAGQLHEMAAIFCSLQTSTTEDLDNAWIFHRLALTHLPADAVDAKATLQIRFVDRILMAVKADGNDVLDKLEAIAAEAREASELDVRNHNLKSAALKSLEVALEHALGRSRNPRTLEELIYVRREKLKHLAAKEAEQPSKECLGQYRKLAMSLQNLFKLSGKVESLDEALSVAYKSIPTGVQIGSFPECVLIASILIDIGEQRNSITDLNKAIDLLNEWRGLLTTVKPALALAMVYDPWARALAGIYRLTREIHFVLDAIAIAEEAVTLFPQFEYGALKGSITHTLLLLYTKKYERSRIPEDASKGVKFGQLSTEFDEQSPEQLSEHRGQLAILFQKMFGATHERKYLDEAIAENRESLKLNGESISTRHNLTNNLLIRYKMYAAPGDLSEALQHIEKTLTTQGHLPSNIGNHESTAAEGYRLKYEASRAEKNSVEADIYLEKALRYFTDSAKSPQNLPLERIRTARAAAKLLGHRSDWNAAHDLLHEAMNWIPKIIPIHMKYSDQRPILEVLSGLASETCSAAILCGKVECAIEDLERGRGIVIASRHKALHDLDTLERTCPELYHSYCSIRDQLLGNTYHSSDKTPDGIESLLSTHSSSSIHLLNTRMQEILDAIHATPGLDQFLKPIKASEMQELCGRKTVIALNRSGFGAHAILVQKGQIRSIPLPSPSPPGFPDFVENLEAGVRLMERCIHPNEQSTRKWDLSQNPQNMLLGLLTILWYHIAQPVVTELGWDPPSVSADATDLVQLAVSRQILWLPTGLYARLPIHASGRFSPGGHDNLLVGRRVVSTYISSFRMLRHSQAISRAAATNLDQGLFLGMPKNSKFDSPRYLRTATQEAKEVIQESKAIIWKILQRPSRNEAIETMSTSAWLHVASHGISDPGEPSASHLLLEADDVDQDEDDPQMSGCLSVQQISDLRVNHGILAFLSACSSAESRVTRLLDENLTLGYAFQVAGFAHVIGHLWPANELVCPSFAGYFYRYLTNYGPIEHGPDRDDAIASCVAHATVSTIVAHDCLQEPLFWAGFVHIGA